MKTKRGFLLMVVAVVVALISMVHAASACAQAFGNQQDDNMSFTVRAKPVEPAQSGLWKIEITIHSDTGWHVYSPGAGEFTIPIEPKIGLPAGVSEFAPWKYPESDDGLGHLTDGQVFYYQVLTADRELLKQIQLDLRYQACNESVCLPPKTIKLDLGKLKLPDPVPVANGADKNDRLDILNRPIDNREVYMLVFSGAQAMIADDNTLDIDELNNLLKEAGQTSTRMLPESKLPNADNIYESMVRSSLMMANVYDCGKCDKQHVSTAGGVVVGPDGLVLTNYHVIEKNPGTFGLAAVTHEGVCHPIIEILAASRADDIALIRLGGDTSDLHPAAIAKQQPGPMSLVNVLSHPHREYFVLTDGRVSRYVHDLRPDRSKTVWMEITADFGGGSSGSGVFNESGELIGLVSTILPLVRKDGSQEHIGDAANPDSAKAEHVELNLHRCVPLDAVHSLFSK